MDLEIGTLPVLDDIRVVARVVQPYRTAVATWFG
jgi:hypothetical protein